MMVRVWDEESIKSNDLVGEVKISLDDICKETETRQEKTFQLEYKSGKAGQIL